MRALLGVLLVPALIGCSSKSNGQPTPTPGWTLTSAVVKEGQPIDRRHTCDGEDLSPPLAWPAAPATVKSLVLVVDDPDAPRGTFTHWLLYGMAPDRTSLAEGVAKEGEVAGLGRQGKNGFDKLGYGGACPPPGAPHHYRFKLYGLSTQPQLAAGAGKEEVEKALAGNVVTYAILTGTYQRAPR